MFFLVMKCLNKLVLVCVLTYLHALFSFGLSILPAKINSLNQNSNSSLDLNPEGRVFVQWLTTPVTPSNVVFALKHKASGPCKGLVRVVKVFVNTTKSSAVILREVSQQQACQSSMAGSD